MSAPKIIIIVVAVLIVGGLGWVIFNSNKPSTPQNQATTPVNTNDRSISLASPTASPISKPVPVTIATARGTVSAVSSSSITIKAATGDVTATFPANVDVQKLTSGTLEKGDAKTSPAKVEDIKVGQEVLLVLNKGTSQARSLLIIK